MSESMKALAQEYLQLRKRKTEMDKRMKEISELLKAHAIDNGVKNSSGSSYCDFGDVVFGNQAKKSVRINTEKATDFFKSIGLYDKVVEITESISEEKIESLIAEGLVTEEDIEAIVDIKTSYAIDIKEIEQEEMPEVEVASRVKPLKKKLPTKRK